jgi:hypothetical protein
MSGKKGEKQHASATMAGEEAYLQLDEHLIHLMSLWSSLLKAQADLEATLKDVCHLILASIIVVLASKCDCETGDLCRGFNSVMLNTRATSVSRRPSTRWASGTCQPSNTTTT